MKTWIVELAQGALAALLLSYIFFTLAFSAAEERRQRRRETARRGFERRALERPDRRLRDLGPPFGRDERRLADRRA